MLLSFANAAQHFLYCSVLLTLLSSSNAAQLCYCCSILLTLLNSANATQLCLHCSALLMRSALLALLSCLANNTQQSSTFDNIDVNGIDQNVKDKYGGTPFHFDGQSRSIPFRPFMSFSSIEKDSRSMQNLSTTVQKQDCCTLIERLETPSNFD